MSSKNETFWILGKLVLIKFPGKCKWCSWKTAPFAHSRTATCTILPAFFYLFKLREQEDLSLCSCLTHRQTRGLFPVYKINCALPTHLIRLHNLTSQWLALWNFILYCFCRTYSPCIGQTPSNRNSMWMVKRAVFFTYCSAAWCQVNGQLCCPRTVCRTAFHNNWPKWQELVL